MMDTDLAYEILDQIEESIARILHYFSPINNPDEFSDNLDNQMRLDAIGMMLIAIGENLKKLDKVIEPSLVKRFPEIDWKGAKGIRDILSHSYFQIQPEVIFQTCQEDIPILYRTIKSLKLSLKSNTK
jgi:uncharacterized protein with HEPN domain